MSPAEFAAGFVFVWHDIHVQIHFSKHALLKLAERNISTRLAREAVKAPDICRPGHYPREEWFKRFRIRYLKVVVVREPRRIVVVTAHWARKSPV